MEELKLLIKDLKKYDNDDGYKLEYRIIKTKLEPIMNQLIQIGEPALGYLHELIIHEETWSCLFALEILKEIRSEKSIPFLIDYIVSNEDGDYWEASENAMKTLNSIGKPAVGPLMKEIKKQFGLKKYLIYLVASLTEIVDDEVYDFMMYYTKDYLKNFSYYKEWFSIGCFTSNFVEQKKTEVLSILKEIQKIGNLSEFDYIELRDTIYQIEDPKGFEEEMNKILSDSEKKYDKKRKLGRNELCWCGSGKKYKKCCLEKDLEERGKPKEIYIIDGKEYFGNLDDFSEE